MDDDSKPSEQSYLRYLERGWEPSWSDLKLIVYAALIAAAVWLVKAGHDYFAAHFHH